MTETVRTASARAAADAFETLGIHGATLEAHAERLSVIEDRQKNFDGRNQQLQVHLASLARLCESNTLAISKVEEGREKDNETYRRELINALRSNRMGAIVLVVVGVAALSVAMTLALTGQLQ